LRYVSGKEQTGVDIWIVEHGSTGGVRKWKEGRERPEATQYVVVVSIDAAVEAQNAQSYPHWAPTECCTHRRAPIRGALPYIMSDQAVRTI